ncbi:MAG: twin transmembrane helix small protein [Pseudomonadota bacterium]|nr:twin transmembrane helix small protein [Pseudomonadota bacterium]
MFDDPLLIIPLVAVLIVLGILLTGIGSFGRGGEFNKRNANKIMRYRIYAQAVAIVLILGYVWLRRQGG